MKKNFMQRVDLKLEEVQMLENEENANALEKDDLKFETINFTKEKVVHLIGIITTKRD